MRHKTRKTIEGILGLIEAILVLAFMLSVVICGGAEFQTTAEAFDRQFWVGGISALACIGGVAICEVIIRELD